MTASAPTIRRAKITVANQQAEPTEAWVRAVARLLLEHADREIAAEHAAGQADGDGQEQDIADR